MVCDCQDKTECNGINKSLKSQILWLGPKLVNIESWGAFVWLSQLSV